MLTLTSCILMHRISKISGSFNPFTEKEAPAPGWPMLFLFFHFLFVSGGPVQCAICTCNPPMCVCVCMRTCVHY